MVEGLAATSLAASERGGVVHYVWELPCMSIHVCRKALSQVR